jgi:hypothetical protein
MSSAKKFATVTVLTLLLGACSASDSTTTSDPGDATESELPQVESPESAPTTSPVVVEDPYDGLPTDDSMASALERLKASKSYPADLRFVLSDESTWSGFLPASIRGEYGNAVIYAAGEPVSTETLEAARKDVAYSGGWQNFWSVTGGNAATAEDAAILTAIEELHVLGSEPDAQLFARRWIDAFKDAGTQPYATTEFKGSFPTGSLGNPEYTTLFATTSEGCESVTIAAHKNFSVQVRVTAQTCLTSWPFLSAAMTDAVMQRIDTVLQEVSE